MKVGDLVQFRKGTWVWMRESGLGLIVNIVIHTETYTSSGCKKYVVLTALGDEYRCWQGELEVINESG